MNCGTRASHRLEDVENDRPGGRVFFVDSGSADRWADVGEQAEHVLIQRFVDGRYFRVVKHYYQPRDLEAGLA